MEKLQTEHGVFTNNEETGQNAQEVYQEWLKNKDKPPMPTKVEILEHELANTNAMILELTELILGGM